MKIETKIKTIGWILIIWGLLRILKAIIFPNFISFHIPVKTGMSFIIFSRIFSLVIITLGIGILLKNRVCASITKWIAFVAMVSSSIVGSLSLQLAIADLFSKSVPKETTKIPINTTQIEFMSVLCVVLCLGFWLIYRFLKRPEVISEFGKKKSLQEPIDNQEKIKTPLKLGKRSLLIFGAVLAFNISAFCLAPGFTIGMILTGIAISGGIIGGLIGAILGILGIFQKNSKKLLPILGLTLNVLLLISIIKIIEYFNKR